MKTYHIRKITNGKPGDYLVQIPSEESEEYRLGDWRRENAGAIEFEKTDGKQTQREIYRINNIRTRLERISEI